MILVSILALGWIALDVSSVEDREKPSPGDWIKKDQIKVYKDKIVIELPNAEWAEFTDTNSMDPFFDSESNSIELKPQSASQLRIGDIISYNTSLSDNIIVHRIVEINADSDGWYVIAKGDNNARPDPEKIRFDQVQGVLVAVLY